jgi:hypothetical protein
MCRRSQTYWTARGADRSAVDWTESADRTGGSELRCGSIDVRSTIGDDARSHTQLIGPISNTYNARQSDRAMRTEAKSFERERRAS